MTLMGVGCDWFRDREPGIGDPVSWRDIPGFASDDLLQSWPAMQSQCPRMAGKGGRWPQLCEIVQSMTEPTAGQLRDFYQTHFRAHRVHGLNNNLSGLITGYYEPILRGSRTPNEQFRFPVYAPPEDMITVDLAELYPQLKGMRLRGRLVGDRLVPYWSRAEIDTGDAPLRGQEILWLDDPHDSFFAQIQGSARVSLADGGEVGIGYANQNGHPYFAVGKKLVEMGELELADVSLFTIRAWLRDNPDRADSVLNANPSYVFFELREQVDDGPRGSLNVPLTAGRSLAVDRNVIPLGSPVWIDTTLPDGSTYQRMMMAQDTGGAISGPVRADVFFGAGEHAEQLAGEMKQSGSLYVLLPLDGQQNE
jgi:membrane-bound lytic murein transglycosylase A